MGRGADEIKWPIHFEVISFQSFLPCSYQFIYFIPEPSFFLRILFYLIFHFCFGIKFIVSW